MLGIIGALTQREVDMFSSGGGFGGLPMTGSPTEMVIVLLLVLGVVWLAYRIFS